VKNRFQSLPFKMQPAALHHGALPPRPVTPRRRRGGEAVQLEFSLTRNLKALWVSTNNVTVKCDFKQHLLSKIGLSACVPLTRVHQARGRRRHQRKRRAVHAQRRGQRRGLITCLHSSTHCISHQLSCFIGISVWRISLFLPLNRV
jgi:hypothetical protein